MTQEDIVHLATLARIELAPQELEALEAELSSIVSYVSVISDIASETSDTTPVAGVRLNIFRADEVTNASNQYTDDLFNEMPDREGRYLKVKKILNTPK